MGGDTYHREGDRSILTAGTRELQRFVPGYLGEGELFEKADELIRKTNLVAGVTPPVSE